MLDLNELFDLCRYAGERFDLVQGTSGNASLHTPDGVMWLKPAGLSLSDLRSEEDLCQVSCEEPLLFISKHSSGTSAHDNQLEQKAKDCVWTAAGKNRSVAPETLMHCLTGPLTLHTHPPIVMSIVCQIGWREKILGLVPEAICVDYATTGIHLALSLQRALTAHGWEPGKKAIIVIENHGLIVSGSSAGEVAATTDDVVGKLSFFIGVDWSRYRLSNRISELVQGVSEQPVCSFYCEDRVLLGAMKRNTSLLLAQPVFPEQARVCGPAGLELTSLDDVRPLVDYIDRYGQSPRVILYRASADHLFIVGKTMKNCREIEQVLKAHAMTLMSASIPKVRFLSDDELIYLMSEESMASVAI